MSVTGRHPHARATIRDIADRAGVSIATVSRVLNGRPDVAAETREAVLEVARQLRFSTNRSARSLSGGRTGLIGVTIPIVHAAYFAFILSGAAEALYEEDLRAVLCPTQHEHDREVDLLGRLMHGTTDGALLMLPSETPEELDALRDFGYPFVVVDARAPLHEGIPAVTAANASGAKQAIAHLLDHGHRRIGVITGPRSWNASNERLIGYHAALAGAGLVPDPQLEVEGDFEHETGYAGGMKLLALPDPPTAIFAFNDDMAVGALNAALQRGLRVPEDLSIVGFDDSVQAQNVSPKLTTVYQPLAEMGRMAVSLLTRILEGQRLEAVRVELGTRLIVRGTTGPVTSR
jgi:LacI family transcriptional regulator, galactose operon repressor